jgi:hypothetical protein
MERYNFLFIPINFILLKFNYVLCFNDKKQYNYETLKVESIEYLIKLSKLENNKEEYRKIINSKSIKLWQDQEKNHKD